MDCANWVTFRACCRLTEPQIEQAHHVRRLLRQLWNICRCLSAQTWILSGLGMAQRQDEPRHRQGRQGSLPERPVIPASSGPMPTPRHRPWKSSRPGSPKKHPHGGIGLASHVEGDQEAKGKCDTKAQLGQGRRTCFKSPDRSIRHSCFCEKRCCMA